MGVIRHRPPFQPAQQLRHIKTPADDPEGLARGRLATQQVSEEGAARFPLPVGDQLGGNQPSGELRCLEFHLKATTAETTCDAGNQKAEMAQGSWLDRHNSGSGPDPCRTQATTGSVLPAR